MGKRFGRLLVVRESTRADGGLIWACLCDCGKETTVRSSKLLNGHTLSCGCIREEVAGRLKASHGLCKNRQKTPEYLMWARAKYRARRSNLPFCIEPSDITIPVRCPLFGILLRHNHGHYGRYDDSPSLDRMIPGKGYVKGNIRVISNKANRLRGDGDIDELRKRCE